MTTLADVQRAIFPTARDLGTSSADPGRFARDVAWVRVLRARVPAFDALDPGDLVIVPAPALAVVAPDPARSDELAAGLARARVPAVILIDGEPTAPPSDPETTALDLLTVSADRSGLAVLSIGRTDPVALERAVIGFLVNRRADLDRRAADLERDLTRLALKGGGLDALAASIGASFGRPVVIEGRRGDPIAVHVPTAMPDAAAAVTAYLARPSSARLRVPIQGPSDQSGSAGRLVLLGDAAIDDYERVASERVAALLALELARDAAIRQAREEPRLGEGLPDEGPPWVVIVARQMGGPASGDAFAREQVRADVRMLAPANRIALRGTRDSLEIRLVAAAPPDDPDGLALAERLVGLLARTVAVSRPFTEPGARPAAEAAARATLEAAEALRTPPLVAWASQLPAYQLLGTVHNVPDGLRQARELLAPILDGRDDVSRERLSTLRAVLGSATLGEAAGRLRVHRNTVAYRVARLEALGEWDLADPELRFALSLAVRLVQDAQE